MDIIKSNIKAIAVVLVCLLVLIAAYFLFRPETLHAVEDSGWFSDGQVEEKIEDNEIAENVSHQFVADVKGEVVRPGVYTFHEGDRIAKLIEFAGGFTEDADQSRVNLAALAEDTMMIVVPSIHDEGVNLDPNIDFVIGGAPVESPSAGDNSGKVNLNTATEVELQTLSGIGPAKASAIIDKREELGSFQSIDDLKKVNGIGEKTFENLKDDVTV